MCFISRCKCCGSPTSDTTAKVENCLLFRVSAFYTEQQRRIKGRKMPFLLLVFFTGCVVYTIYEVLAIILWGQNLETNLVSIHWYGKLRTLIPFPHKSSTIQEPCGYNPKLFIPLWEIPNLAYLTWGIFYCVSSPMWRKHHSYSVPPYWRTNHLGGALFKSRNRHSEAKQFWASKVSSLQLENCNVLFLTLSLQLWGPSSFVSLSNTRPNLLL